VKTKVIDLTKEQSISYNLKDTKDFKLELALQGHPLTDTNGVFIDCFYKSKNNQEECFDIYGFSRLGLISQWWYSSTDLGEHLRLAPLCYIGDKPVHVGDEVLVDTTGANNNINFYEAVTLDNFERLESKAIGLK
jgi:hypothetical protein